MIFPWLCLLHCRKHQAPGFPSPHIHTHRLFILVSKAIKTRNKSTGSKYETRLRPLFLLFVPNSKANATAALGTTPHHYPQNDKCYNDLTVGPSFRTNSSSRENKDDKCQGTTTCRNINLTKNVVVIMNHHFLEYWTESRLLLTRVPSSRRAPTAACAALCFRNCSGMCDSVDCRYSCIKQRARTIPAGERRGWVVMRKKKRFVAKVRACA